MSDFKTSVRGVLSVALKFATAISALGGVLLSLIYARADGYTHWAKRLMYFTAQSNLWLGFTFVALLVLPLLKEEKAVVLQPRLYLLKYIFTVSITMTGLVFCLLLAPFCDENYRPWTLPSLLTHVFSPVFAVVDLFVDPRRIPLTKKQVWLCALPPVLYFFPASILCVLNADFGRGVPYPYFFLNYRSPAGVFGFSNEFPFFMGSFYWMALFSIVVIGLGFLYARLIRKKTKG